MLNRRPSLLDHIYTNQHDKKINSSTTVFLINGHDPIYALIEKGIKKCQRRTIYKMYSHNFQLDVYIADLRGN